MTNSDNTARILENFEQARTVLPGSWLAETRSGAISAFEDSGFPTPRTEAWKYTNLNRLVRTEFDPLSQIDAPDTAEWAHLFIEGADRIVILNGRYDAASSAIGDLPDGVALSPLSVAVDRGGSGLEADLGHIAPVNDAALVALNTAFMRDGLVLTLPNGTVLERPVQVVHIVDCGDAQIAVHPRVLVIAGDNSEATVVETFGGAGEAVYWTNAVSEIRVGANAFIRHVKLQAEGTGAFHTAATQVRLDRDARYSSTALSTGARLSRNETKVAFNGPGADCTLTGGALLRGRQHADNTTEADHRVPHTTSNQVFRNVLDDNSRSVFQGGVIVRQDAQKTDSSQSNRNLLLAPGAQADTKPELQIFADDVKCAHGATVGDLDRDALFYLQSRGIPTDQAKALLIEAFVGEILDDLPEGDVREHIVGAISGWMLAPEGGRV